MNTEGITSTPFQVPLDNGADALCKTPKISSEGIRYDIKQSASAGDGVGGDMSAFSIAKVERFLNEDDAYVYRLFGGVECEGDLSDFSLENRAVFTDIAVDAIPQDSQGLILAKQKVIAAEVKIMAGLQEDEWSTEGLLKAFEGAEEIYRQWPLVRSMREEAALIKLRDDCMRVLSKVAACHYAKLPGILENEPAAQYLKQGIAAAFKRAKNPSSFIFSSQVYFGSSVLVENAVKSEIGKAKYEDDPSLLHDHGITKEQYFSAERKRRKLEQFPVTPVMG